MNIIQEPWFKAIKRPSRYIGGEINSIKKGNDRIDVSICLAFPDLYEIGMSHLGIKILYHILNGRSWIRAERVFCPAKDLGDALKERGIPLMSLESCTSVSKFDLVGFSIQHELCLTNVLYMLELSGIPLRSDERKDPFPLIIAGGPGCFNPEPFSPIFDAILIGDGERASVEICKVVRKFKKRRFKDRDALLIELSHIDGVYIPSFFEVEYDRESVRSIENRMGTKNFIEKAIIPDLNQYPLPESPIIPNTISVHERLSVEISRGCGRGCRFCQAGMIYRPVRERSPHSIISYAEEALKNTGYEELSLLSLSSGDYSCIRELLGVLMDRVSDKKVAISLPSLRVDSFDPEWLRQIKRVRKTGFTLAPEVGTERLRAIINKPIRDEEIIDISSRIFASGWNLIKLYFMIGLPHEKWEDIEGIYTLSSQVSRQKGGIFRRYAVNVSLSVFVPKAHTPFMWESQMYPDKAWKIIKMLKRSFHRPCIRLKFNPPEMSWLEGIISRGDRRLFAVILSAYRRGALFDSWSESFSKEIWDEALKEHGIDPEIYLRGRDRDELFPWEHLRCGVEKSYMFKEWERAKEGKITPDCRSKCSNCGVCDSKDIGPKIFKDIGVIELSPFKAKDKRSSTKRFMLVYSKKGPSIFLSHLEFQNMMIRALRRAGINMEYSKGFHPMPKVSFLSALPVGIGSLHETMIIEIRDPDMEKESLKERINKALFEGVRILHIEELPSSKINFCVDQVVYSVKTKDRIFKYKNLKDFLSQREFHVIKWNGRRVDLKAQIKEIRWISENELVVTLKNIQGPKLNIQETLKKIFKLRDQDLHRCEILKIDEAVNLKTFA